MLHGLAMIQAIATSTEGERMGHLVCMFYSFPRYSADLFTMPGWRNARWLTGDGLSLSIRTQLSLFLVSLLYLPLLMASLKYIFNNEANIIFVFSGYKVFGRLRFHTLYPAAKYLLTATVESRRVSQHRLYVRIRVVVKKINKASASNARHCSSALESEVDWRLRRGETKCTLTTATNDDPTRACLLRLLSIAHLTVCFNVTPHYWPVGSWLLIV